MRHYYYVILPLVAKSKLSQERSNFFRWKMETVIFIGREIKGEKQWQNREWLQQSAVDGTPLVMPWKKRSQVVHTYVSHTLVMTGKYSKAREWIDSQFRFSTIFQALFSAFVLSIKEGVIQRGWNQEIWIWLKNLISTFLELSLLDIIIFLFRTIDRLLRINWSYIAKLRVDISNK